MKKAKFYILCFSLLTLVISCNNKKLTEVVEVPLPTAEEKFTIGSPNDVEANDGTFELVKLPDIMSLHFVDKETKVVEIYWQFLNLQALNQKDIFL